MLRPAGVAVAGAHSHVVITQSRQHSGGAGGQFLDDFHTVHMTDQPGEYGGLVARAGPHFEYNIAGLRVEQVGHQGYDEGLGNGLARLDRQRCVLVGTVTEGREHERLPRDPAHRRHDSPGQLRAAGVARRTAHGFTDGVQHTRPFRWHVHRLGIDRHQQHHRTRPQKAGQPCECICHSFSLDSVPEMTKSRAVSRCAGF